MPNISTYTLPQMTDLVKRSFVKKQANFSKIMRDAAFVVSDVIPHGTGDTKRFAERITRNQYASTRAEGAVSQMAQVQYGWEKDATAYTVSLEISITKRMRDAGKNQEMLDQITDLSEVCPNRMELDLSHRFTFAWSTSYVTLEGTSTDITTGDGKALIATDHALTGSATTYSTQILGNPAFSKAALEIGEKSYVEGSFNNLGEKVPMKPDTIMTTDDPNTIHQVQELMNATADVLTSNSGTHNVYRGAYKHVINPRIATTATGGVDATKAKYWFLLCSMSSDLHFSVLNDAYLKTPADGNNGEEFSSENWKYLAGADYCIAAVTAKWVRGSKGDAS